LIGGIRFYERKEIKDLIAYLRVIANPNDTASHERLEKMGKTRYRKFLNWTQSLAPITPIEPENLFTSADQNSQVSSNTYTTLELLEKTLEVTSYLEYIDDGTEVAAGRIENIKELKTVATQYSTLRDFLEQVSLVEGPNSTLQADATENAVTMMTLHAAKGLEFKHVFIIGWEEGLFPHARAVLQKEEIEEERRLAYVGITRAMEDLFLCYAVSRMIYGSRNNTVVSRFIADIPEELLQFEKSYEHIRPTYSRRENWNDDIYW
jgi:DNA helicase-2/ATP-dependent DNA helicase PcrA